MEKSIFGGEHKSVDIVFDLLKFNCTSFDYFIFAFSFKGWELLCKWCVTSFWIFCRILSSQHLQYC